MYCCHLLLWSSAICFCIFSFIVSDCCGSSFFSKLLKLILSLSILYGAIFSCCSDIKNWICNIEQHASDNVNKILVGNKADMDESKRVGVLWLIILQQMLSFHLVGWILSSLIEHTTAFLLHDLHNWCSLFNPACNHLKSMREGWLVDWYVTLQPKKLAYWLGSYLILSSFSLSVCIHVHAYVLYC